MPRQNVEQTLCRNLAVMFRHEPEQAIAHLVKRGYSPLQAANLMAQAMAGEGQRSGGFLLSALRLNRFLWPGIPWLIMTPPLVYSLGWQRGFYLSWVLTGSWVASLLCKRCLVHFRR